MIVWFAFFVVALRQVLLRFRDYQTLNYWFAATSFPSVCSYALRRAVLYNKVVAGEEVVKTVIKR